MNASGPKRPASGVLPFVDSRSPVDCQHTPSWQLPRGATIRDKRQRLPAPSPAAEVAAMHHREQMPAHSARSGLESFEVSRPPVASAFATLSASSMDWNSQEDTSRCCDEPMPAASQHNDHTSGRNVHSLTPPAQGPMATLTVMQNMLDSRDAEIGQLRTQLVQAVSAEKQRWAATFHSLVAAMRPPVHALQQRVRTQEDTIQQLQAKLAHRTQPSTSTQAGAPVGPAVAGTKPADDAHDHARQPAGGLSSSPKRDRPLQQNGAAESSPRHEHLGSLPGMTPGNQAGQAWPSQEPAMQS